MSTVEFNMDLDWRFKMINEENIIEKTHSAVYKSSKGGFVSGIPGKEYDDSDWEKVSLPHDYYVGIGFDENNIKTQGYHNHSDAWYRKTFSLSSKNKGKAYNLVFEGIAGKAKIFFNGFFIGETQSTYCEYIFDVTDYVYNDERLNVLAVNINGSTLEGWWYEGAGIYRHVKLLEKELIHIAHNGVFAKPVIKETKQNDWNVFLSVEIENKAYTSQNVYATVELLYNEEKISKYTTDDVESIAGGMSIINSVFEVYNPKRWDIESPNLYILNVDLWSGKNLIDSKSVKIGFRTIKVDPNHGFFLNDRKVLIKGTCNHQDHAGVGVAMADSLHKWRIKRLKEIGTNAYRCAHNMHSREILDACDELGMLVMDENRHFACDPITLSQVESMVRRDRNHPSVVFWSLFNEEPLQSSEEGARIFKRMKQFVLEMDDSRLVTGAINGSLEGAALEMDIVGLNYLVHQADIAHEKYPNMAIIGSENNSAVTTRGCYFTDRKTAQVLSNYDEETPMWGSTIRDMWRFVREREYFAGIFVWTGFDYRGEPTPFEWPSVSSQFGILDACGFEKDAFYYHKACFTDVPMVHLLPHWTWKKGDTVRVVAVTNCDEVELLLNGKSLGKKTADVCEPPEWSVDFEAGEIVAKAYNLGVLVAEDKQVTASEPYKIKLFLNNETINNSGQDMILVNAAVVDENDVLVPDADNLITFEVKHDGIIKGTGNGNPNSHEDDTQPYRLAYHGLCQAVVAANQNAKTVKVVARSEGIKTAEISIPIIEIPNPNYMPSSTSSNVGGFTVSSVFTERPDPLMKIHDNDMNTFTPFIVPPTGYRCDFNAGWQIYRTVQSLQKGEGEYELAFSSIKGEVVEVYVNGVLKASGSYPLADKVSVSFKGKDNEMVEIRVLVSANNNLAGCGISGFVTLKKIQ